MNHTPPPPPRKSGKPVGYRGYSPSPQIHPANTSGLLSPDRTPTPPPQKKTRRSLPVARTLSYGGNKEEMVEYKGGSYKVRTGPKGGKYILVKEEKVYLKK